MLGWWLTSRDRVWLGKGTYTMPSAESDTRLPSIPVCSDAGMLLAPYVGPSGGTDAGIPKEEVGTLVFYSPVAPLPTFETHKKARKGRASAPLVSQSRFERIFRVTRRADASCTTHC